MPLLKVYNPAVMSNHERTTTEPPIFIDVLNNVMSDPNYLAGAEPEGSGWDFHDWPGYDFRQFREFVLAEKFFGIPTLDGKGVSMSIVQTDPEQFHVSGMGVSFVISPARTKVLPTILIGKDASGSEVVLRNSREPVEYHGIPDCLHALAQQIGVLSKNKVASDSEGSQWAAFLKEVLHLKRILPKHFGPTENTVRDQLELRPDEPVGDEERLFAEMKLVEQELIGYAYSHFVIG